MFYKFIETIDFPSLLTEPMASSFSGRPSASKSIIFKKCKGIDIFASKLPVSYARFAISLTSN
jgi:hypothetical protein